MPLCNWYKGRLPEGFVSRLKQAILELMNYAPILTARVQRAGAYKSYCLSRSNRQGIDQSREIHESEENTKHRQCDDHHECDDLRVGIGFFEALNTLSSEHVEAHIKPNSCVYKPGVLGLTAVTDKAYAAATSEWKKRRKGVEKSDILGGDKKTGGGEAKKRVI